MKTKKIKNLADLRAEIKVLHDRAGDQEKIIRADIEEIKERLKPKNILLDALQGITGIKFDRKNIFENGLSAGLLLLLRKYISKTEAKAEDKVYEIADRIFERIRNFISKYMHVRKHYPDDKKDSE
jgi:hypothetical protein